MSKRESICEQCALIFTHKNDRMGKFCSQKCHYGSKRESANCGQCHKEFKRRKKEPRKTCSKTCFMISRGIKIVTPGTPLFYDILDKIKEVFQQYMMYKKTR